MKTGRAGVRPWVRAAGEFTVIVVGVLTALGVDEWRSSRDERTLLSEYVSGLAADIGDELTYLEHVADLSRARMAAADRVLMFLGEEPGHSDSTAGYVAPTGFSEEGIAQDLSESSKMQFFVPEAVAWDDLTTTGNLRLIRDADVRRRAVPPDPWLVVRRCESGPSPPAGGASRGVCVRPRSLGPSARAARAPPSA